MAKRNKLDQNPDTGWNSIGRAAGVLAYLLLLGCFVVPFYPRFAEYKRLDEEGRMLEQERDSLKKTMERREAELTLLDRDPAFVEMKARDRLDLCRDNEVIFRFDDVLVQ